MADAAAATPAPAAATLKKVKKTAAKKPSAKPSHPKTADMVLSAVKNLKKRGGSSLQAIKKYIAANYKVDADKLSPFIRKYVKSAVASGALIQIKGKGASGSFKLGKDSEKKAAPKKAAAKDKKPKEKKEKKPKIAGAAKKSAPKKATGAAKKAVAAKKPAGEAKKPKIPKKRKSPSKVKKSKAPAAAKKPKSKKATAKPKSPEKAAPKK